MKRTIIYSLILLLFSVLILSNPSVSQQAISSGLSICKEAILPVLFPFFVVTELLISWGFTHWLERIASPWMNAFFHLPGSAASAWILGSLGGYPVGVKTVATLYQSKTLSREDCQQCILFLNNAGPSFIIGIAGNLLLHSARAGLLLWIVHLVSSAIIGILFRPPKKEDTTPISSKPPASNVFPSIATAIVKAGETGILVCTFILFFSILLAWLSALVPPTHRTALWFPVLTGSIELTAGMAKLSSISMPDEMRFVAAAFLLGWGGLCVHCQSISILTKSGLSAGSYLAGKTLHAFVSLGLACLVAPLLYSDSPSLFSVVLHAAPLLLIVILIRLLPKTTSGKLSANRI